MDCKNKNATGCETNTMRALHYVTNNKKNKCVYAYSITELIRNQQKSFNETNKKRTKIIICNEPFTNNSLKNAVILWCRDSIGRNEAITNYGHISSWNTSNVTVMNSLFQGTIVPGADTFNDDISNWDVSNVVDMSYMFNLASNFNQDLSNWNVNKVKNMSLMFSECDDFQAEGLEKWGSKLNSITNIDSMFFSIDISSQQQRIDIENEWINNNNISAQMLTDAFNAPN